MILRRALRQLGMIARCHGDKRFPKRQKRDSFEQSRHIVVICENKNIILKKI